jgi:hypothetical protein
MSKAIMQSAYHYQPTARVRAARGDTAAINPDEGVSSSRSIRSAHRVYRRRIIARFKQAHQMHLSASSGPHSEHDDAGARREGGDSALARSLLNKSALSSSLGEFT